MNVYDVYLQKEQHCKNICNFHKFNKEEKTFKKSKIFLKYFSHIKRDGGEKFVIFYAIVVVSFDQYTMTRRGRSEI